MGNAQFFISLAKTFGLELLQEFEFDSEVYKFSPGGILHYDEDSNSWDLDTTIISKITLNREGIRPINNNLEFGSKYYSIYFDKFEEPYIKEYTWTASIQDHMRKALNIVYTDKRLAIEFMEADYNKLIHH